MLELPLELLPRKGARLTLKEREVDLGGTRQKYFTPYSGDTSGCCGGYYLLLAEKHGTVHSVGVLVDTIQCRV